jgi:hypothetical protein
MAKRIFSTNVAGALGSGAVCAFALAGAVWAVATFAASPPSSLTSSARGGRHEVASRNLASFADIVDAVKPTVFAVEARVASDAAQDTQDAR